MLAVSSSHPMSIHRNWPIAFVTRLWRRSSSLMHFGIAKCAFLERLREQGYPAHLRARIELVTDFFTSFHALPCKPSIAACDAQPCLWTALDFHPIQSVLAMVNTRPLFTDLLGAVLRVVPKICLAWRLPRKPLGNSLVAW
jgi:hypothetical protein